MFSKFISSKLELANALEPIYLRLLPDSISTLTTHVSRKAFMSILLILFGIITVTRCVIRGRPPGKRNKCKYSFIFFKIGFLSRLAASSQVSDGIVCNLGLNVIVLVDLSSNTFPSSLTKS